MGFKRWVYVTGLWPLRGLDKTDFLASVFLSSAEPGTKSLFNKYWLTEVSFGGLTLENRWSWSLGEDNATGGGCVLC